MALGRGLGRRSLVVDLGNVVLGEAGSSVESGLLLEGVVDQIGFFLAMAEFVILQQRDNMS